MLKVERKKWIENYLKIHGSLIISKVHKELKCSEETLRKDIIELDKEGKVIKTHGGAYLNDESDKSFPVNIRGIMYKEEKVFMSNIAIRFIPNNSTIFLDSSTTCQEIANRIIENDLHTTIITNSMGIIEICENFPNIKLILLGGKFRKRNKSFIGYNTTETLLKYHADISFVSFPTFNLELGLGDNNLEESKVRETMLKNSNQKFLVMDNTKFFNNTANFYSNYDNYNYVITNKKLDDEWTNFLKNKLIYN